MEIDGIGEPVLLHAGGWDEILLVAVPILLFALFRWLATRRDGAEKEEGEEGAVGPGLLVAVGGLVAVGALAGVLLLSGDGGDTSTDPPSNLEETLLGLCAASSEAAEGSVEDAGDVFYDRSHQGLHDLAAQASDEDRAAVTRLLETKQRVEALLRGGASPGELRSQLRRLLDAASEAARAIDVPPPPCPEGD